MTTTFERLLKELRCEHKRQLSELISQNTSLNAKINEGNDHGGPIQPAAQSLGVASQNIRLSLTSRAVDYMKPSGTQVISTAERDVSRAPKESNIVECQDSGSPPPPHTTQDSSMQASMSTLPSLLKVTDSAKSSVQLFQACGTYAAASKQPFTNASTELTHEVARSSLPFLGLSQFRSLKDTIKSSEAEFIIALCILLSALVNLLELQFNGLKRGHSLGVRGYGNEETLWGTGIDVLNVFDIAFSILFILEFAARLIALRIDIIFSLWNWLDFVAVLSSVLHWFFGESFSGGKGLRCFRIIKVVRVMRALKVYINFFNILHVLARSISCSFSILCWALVVIFGVQCTCAVIMTQILESVYDQESKDSQQKVFRYFGTFTLSLLSMFEMLLANYATPCRVLVDNAGEGYGFVVTLYRAVCGFSILAVVQSVFLQQTTKVMSQDGEFMLAEKAQTEKKYHDNLNKLFHTLDLHGDGRVTWDDLASTFGDPQVRFYCHILGLDPHDLEDIYHLVDNGHGVSSAEFLEAARQIRRQARTIDMARALANLRKVSQQITRLPDRVVDTLIARNYVAEGSYPRNTDDVGAERSLVSPQRLRIQRPFSLERPPM